MSKITIKTKAIVLQSIKYGDSSLIVKMLTEELGLQSYMVKGVFGKKSKMKPALFQNMTLLDIVCGSANGSLGFIKEISLSHYYKSIATDIKKSTIIIFIGELLSKSISESETDINLFNFIYDSMLWLDDATSDYADFPIIFAIRLSAHLGFFPNIETYKEGYCFDLLDGNFKKVNNDIYQIDENISSALNNVCQLSISSQDWPAGSQIFSFSNSSILTTRRQLLDAIIIYFKLHSDNVKEVRSIDILREIL